jgi:hypothetical protein
LSSSARHAPCQIVATARDKPSLARPETLQRSQRCQRPQQSRERNPFSSAVRRVTLVRDILGSTHPPRKPQHARFRAFAPEDSPHHTCNPACCGTVIAA